MANFTYRDWVPGRSRFPKFKKLVSNRFDANVKDVWLIDQPRDANTGYEGDKDWPPDNNNPPSPNQTKLLPAANIQFKLSSSVFIQYDTSASALAWYLISIGTGNWILDEEDREGSHFENEEFRCIIEVKTMYLVQGSDPFSDFMMGGGIGASRNYPADFNEVKITNFWIVEYDNSKELQDIITAGKYPYTIQEFRYKKNKLLSRIPESVSVREFEGYLVGAPGSSQEIHAEFVFPNETKNQGYTVQDLEQLSTGDYSWSAPKSGIYFPILNPKSSVKITLIDQRFQSTYISNADMYMRSIRGQGITPFSRVSHDEQLGYEFVTYNDKNTNLLLKATKNSKDWFTKVLIESTDLAAGYNANIIYKPDGKISLIWEKIGGKLQETTSLTGNVIRPGGGVKTLPDYTSKAGIWEAYIDYVDVTSTGQVWFSETQGTGRGFRWEIPLIMDGSNPVLSSDEQTGVDYLFYWRRWRYFPENIATGNKYIVRPIDAATITLGAIYCVKSKDGNNWDGDSILVLPGENDNTTEIPQQTVGVDSDGEGSFIVSWVDKDNVLNIERITVNDKVSSQKSLTMEY